MTNADKFKNIFGLYATELWSMPEKDFLKWLNSEAVNCSEFPNNSDTISRQAAIDAIHNLYAIHGSEGSWIDQKDAFKALNSLPFVQPERKKGKWLRSGNCIFPYECDKCGDTNERATPFCPNCGADMRGEQDG